MDQSIDYKALAEEKQRDIEELASFIFKTFRAMGVKSFEDIDNVGKTVMKEVPKIVMESSVAKHKLRARFAHFEEGRGLLEKYQHLIPKE